MCCQCETNGLLDCNQYKPDFSRVKTFVLFSWYEFFAARRPAEQRKIRRRPALDQALKVISAPVCFRATEPVLMSPASCLILPSPLPFPELVGPVASSPLSGAGTTTCKLRPANRLHHKISGLRSTPRKHQRRFPKARSTLRSKTQWLRGWLCHRKAPIDKCS